MSKEIAQSLNSIANAITPTDALPGSDAAGGHVASLTEAIMGVTSALVSIAGAIEELARAVDRHE